MSVIQRLLLVTGMSGAGKSTALDALEDIGWECIDNLPPALLHDFVASWGQAGETVPIAIGMDVRSRGFEPDQLADLVRGIAGVAPEILYLDCSASELGRRFDSTRRRHPLAIERPAEDGIARERELTLGLRRAADSLLDTTDMSPAELRDELRRRYGAQSGQPVLTITSFSFARGVARNADMLFDMRFVDNPHWVAQLRPLTGLDRAVADHVARDPAWAPTLDRIETLLIDLLPRYWKAGKTYLTIAFGCTGGRHRSVAAAEALATRLRAVGYSPNVRHRDLAPVANETIEGDPAAKRGDGSQ